VTTKAVRSRIPAWRQASTISPPWASSREKARLDRGEELPELELLAIVSAAGDEEVVGEPAEDHDGDERHGDRSAEQLRHVS